MTVQELMGIVESYKNITKAEATIIAVTPEEWVSLQTDMVKEGITLEPASKPEDEFFGRGVVQGSVNGISIILMEDEQSLEERVEEDLEYLAAMRASSEVLVECSVCGEMAIDDGFEFFHQEPICKRCNSMCSVEE